MIRQASKYLFAIAASFAVAACGGSDGGPSFTTAADSATMEMLAENAYELAGGTFNVFLGGEPGIPLPFGAAGSTGEHSGTRMALMYLDRARRMAELRHPGQLPVAPALAGAMRSAPFSTCEPTETGVDEFGDPIDSDNDNVPDNYTVNFGSACVEEDSAGTHRITYSGSVNFKDTDVGLFSFAVTINHLKAKLEDLSSGDGLSIAVNGTEAFNAATALASHTLNWTQALSSTSGGTTSSLSYSDNESATFDPDAGLSIAMDAPLPNGVFDFSADYRIVGENSGGAPNFRVVLDTPTPLHYNTSCVSDIDAGVFRGLLSGNETVGFTATWSGCSDPAFDYFGYTTPATVAAR